MKQLLSAAGAMFAFGATAKGDTVYVQNFNNVSAFQGSYSSGYGPGDPSINTYSEAWNPTYYATIRNGDGWTFYNGAQYVTNGDATRGQATDGAVLLNEGASNTSPLATVDLTGLTVGNTYTVSFRYWGDNVQGDSYTLTSYINSTLVYQVNGIDGAAGSNPSGHVGSYTFVATSATEQLGFGQITNASGSPIIDDVLVSSPVPLPSTAWGGLSLLGGLGLFKFRRGKAATA